MGEFFRWFLNGGTGFFSFLACLLLILYTVVKFIMSLSDTRSSWLFALLSPVIRELLQEALTQVYLKALETPNKWDDLCVKTLLWLVGAEVPPSDPEE